MQMVFTTFFGWVALVSNINKLCKHEELRYLEPILLLTICSVLCYVCRNMLPSKHTEKDDN